MASAQETAPERVVSDAAVDGVTGLAAPSTAARRLRGIVGRGARSGFRTAWELAIIVVPIYCGVTILKHTPAMPALEQALAPGMKFLLLPGKAAVAVAAGVVIGIYAGLGAAASLGLSPQETTVVGFIIVTAHALPMESGVLSRMGARGIRISFLRLAAAFAGAALVSRVIIER
jgi:spore maturation protein SpmB